MKMGDNDVLNIPVDEAVNVDMTKDRMLGVISFSSPENGGRRLTYDDLMKAIKEKGIVEGINEADIKELVSDKKYNYKYIIAKGKAPENGKDAQITLTFNPEQLNKLKPRENDDGTVDFKDLDNVRNVKKGEILARKTPATDGVDGVNILGQVLKARKGKDIRLPKGKNTAITDDGLMLVATEEGKLEYNGREVSISTVCFIPGDVDNSTGNIDFIGSVIINGTVHSGFTVKAKGSVEVRGPVEGATIIAGGDIILSYGVQGTETSRLEAGGNIIAKFIQNSYIQAEKDVITEGIWHSNVNAGGEVKVDVGKGSIVGGNISATNVVLARNIGSAMGAATDIQIGIQPCVYTEYKELADNIKKEEQELSDIEKEIIFMKTRNIGKMDSFKERKLQKLMYDRKQLFDQLQEDKQRYTKLSERMEGIKDGRVEVLGKIYPGVKMVMGNLTKYIQQIQQKCVFIKSDGKITTDSIINLQNKNQPKMLQEESTRRFRENRQIEDEDYIENPGVIRYKKNKL